MKECIKCKVFKEVVEFPIRKDSPDGRRNTCMSCKSEYHKKRNKGEIIKRDFSAPEGMKMCRKCGNAFDVKNFGKSNKNKDGLKSYCKNCKRKESEEWRNKNKEYGKKYREDNRNKAIEYGREYYKENKDILAEKKKEYVEENKDVVAARKKKWYEDNKEKVYENKTRRRARKIGCEEIYGHVERRITLAAFEYKCFKCGAKDNLHIDHHWPLIGGNALSLDNAVVLCRTCNLSKATKNPKEFYGEDACNILNEKLSSILEENKNKVKEI